MCDGGENGTGWSDRRGWGELSVNRTINMKEHSGYDAVTITGANTKIKIKSKLTVRDSRGKNTTAIKVEKGGELVVNDADVAEVQKGIVVDGLKSSVMVVEGKIGVKNGGGGSLIEVSNNGEVVLNKWVTIKTVSGSMAGEVVINNGGTVELKGTGLSVSKGTGIKIKGATGMATVRGGGATITVGRDGTGLDVEGNANVVELEIKGSGGKGRGMLINGSGTVVMTKVKLMQLEMGARVTNGTLKILGESTIDVTRGGTGLDVSGGEVKMEGGSITVGVGGKGMSVSGGKATMVMGSITGNGSGSKGVVINGMGTVTLNSVTMKQLETGVEVDGGTLKILGESTIAVGAGGKGMEVMGGDVTMTGGSLTIMGKGNTGTGVVMKGGTVTLERVDISEVGTGIWMEGKSLKLDGGSIRGNGGGGSKGVYVTGGSGNVTLENVNISEVEMGIWMEGSGELKVEEGTTIQFKGTYGVYAGGGVTANLTKVEIKGSGGNGSKGVSVNGGNLTVIGGEIKGVEDGIYAVGGGVLKVKDGTRIEFTGEYGVYVGESVTSAELTGVTITGKGNTGTGIEVMGGKVTMMMDGVNISEVATGINMEGGTLKVEGGTIGFTKDYGVYVGESVTSAELTGVTITGKGGSGTGVWVEGKSLTVEGVTRITGVKAGIAMMGYGVLKVKDGTRIEFEGEYGYGIYVGEGVTSASLTGVTITGRGGKGVGVYAMGEKVTVSGGMITGVKAGIFAVKGGTLIMKEGTRIQFKGSDGYGVYVGEGVRATLTKVEIKGSGKGYGIEVAKEGAVWLKETHLRNVAKGMTIEEGVTIMEGGEITFTGGHGISLTGGYAFLGEVNIEGKETGQEGIKVSEGMLDLYKTNVRDVYKGMTVWRGGIRMFGGSVEFTGDYGIDLTRGYAFLGEVEIKGKETRQEGIKVSEGMLNLYKTNVRGVYKGMTVKEGSVVRMLEGEITFKGEHAISLTKGYVDLRKVNMTYKEDNKVKGADVVSPNFIKVDGGKVLAEKVTITGNGGKGQGVKVANGGAVWLKETNFSNVRSGMTVERGGIMRMEGGAITFTGGHGISVSGGAGFVNWF
ncbi:right-handed parallel beta-helix repeat-containing protein [Bartonella schoenbuchensis]|uniref:right-handed parallel beta-helix repeat-containing protein n=2 Tax=Bartonella TaxID=773 RepID=UPI0031CC7B8A